MKKIYNIIKTFLKEAVAQIFTILGFSISWFLMTGTAKDIVGLMIVVSFALWFLTINFRKS